MKKRVRNNNNILKSVRRVKSTATEKSSIFKITLELSLIVQKSGNFYTSTLYVHDVTDVRYY